MAWRRWGPYLAGGAGAAAPQSARLQFPAATAGTKRAGRSPQLAPGGGTVSVPAFEVRFRTNNGYGTDSIAYQLTTSPLKLSVTQLPGVDPGDLVVSSPLLELDSEWTLPAEPIKPGDALTLSVTRRSRAVSAMLLPPLPVFETAGLAAYPAEPLLTDLSNRGQLVGERTDTVTWILEQPGSYRFPAVRFRWWNPADETLREQLVGGISLEVLPIADAELADNDAALAEPAHSPLWGYLSGLVLMSLLALGLTALAAHHRARLLQLWRRVLPPRRRLVQTLNPGQD